MSENGRITDAQETALRKVADGPGGATAMFLGQVLAGGTRFGGIGAATERALTVLRSLEKRGFVRQDAGLWRLTPAGREAIGGGDR